MKGSEVFGASAIKAGCMAFFGYPITPQNEIPEYMSAEMIKAGRVFVQAESEVAAINMVYGAAAAGVRCMTSSSSPGIALKQEGIAYCCGAELPCVIGSISRGGPGLGGIQPSQGDYFQATRGGGNGDYHVLVYAPSTLQELSDIMQKAFYKADVYRNPVMVLVDGAVAQMMEGVEIRDMGYPTVDKSSWAASGKAGAPAPHMITSMYLNTDVLERKNAELQKKYNEIIKNETEVEEYLVDDAEFIIVAYGTAARIVRNSVEDLRAMGIKVGLVRPITLWPFPYDAIANLPAAVKGVMTLELCMGQMIWDVKYALAGRFKDVGFYGRTGGNFFDSNEARDAILKYIKDNKILEVK
jgi:2-oxoglutarate ferredoxin oxidoreductase subunit alpha